MATGCLTCRVEARREAAVNFHSPFTIYHSPPFDAVGASRVSRYNGRPAHGPPLGRAPSRNSGASQGRASPHRHPKFVKDAAMITCARCQTENIEGSQYCDECGAALEPATAGGPVGRARTSEHAGPGTEAVASDSGAAPRAPASELRAVPKPQPISPA